VGLLVLSAIPAPTDSFFVYFNPTHSIVSVEWKSQYCRVGFVTLTDPSFQISVRAPSPPHGLSTYQTSPFNTYSKKTDERLVR
jgi:hypothetical protein